MWPVHLQIHYSGKIILCQKTHDFLKSKFRAHLSANGLPPNYDEV